MRCNRLCRLFYDCTFNIILETGVLFDTLNSTSPLLELLIINFQLFIYPFYFKIIHLLWKKNAPRMWRKKNPLCVKKSWNVFEYRWKNTNFIAIIHLESQSMTFPKSSDGGVRAEPENGLIIFLTASRLRVWFLHD